MPLRVRLDLSLAARLRRHAAGARAARRRLADDARDDAADRIVRTTPVRTGRLRQSWIEAAAGGGPDADATAGESEHRSGRTATSLVPYARYVEYGTAGRRPRRIVAAALRKTAGVVGRLFRPFR